MKVFIIGLPQSGRTSVAKHLSKDADFHTIEIGAYLKNIFKRSFSGPEEDFCDKYKEFIANILKNDSKFYKENLRYLKNSIKLAKKNGVKNFVIEDLVGPMDFIKLFNYNEDIVVFLNRLDNPSVANEQENICLSLIKDYCLWLVTMSCLDKDRWIEYNFKSTYSTDNTVKTMGVHNSIFILKSFEGVASHLSDILKACQVKHATNA